MYFYQQKETVGFVSVSIFCGDFWSLSVVFHRRGKKLVGTNLVKRFNVNVQCRTKFQTCVD